MISGTGLLSSPISAGQVIQLLKTMIISTFKLLLTTTNHKFINIPLPDHRVTFALSSNYQQLPLRINFRWTDMTNLL